MPSAGFTLLLPVVPTATAPLQEQSPLCHAGNGAFNKHDCCGHLLWSRRIELIGQNDHSDTVTHPSACFMQLAVCVFLKARNCFCGYKSYETLLFGLFLSVFPLCKYKITFIYIVFMEKKLRTLLIQGKVRNYFGLFFFHKRHLTVQPYPNLINHTLRFKHFNHRAEG